MNQRRALCKAVSLLRPVLASARERRPARFSMRDADHLVVALLAAEHHLEKAVALYEAAANPEHPRALRVSGGAR